MSGNYSGVQSQIKEVCEFAIYVPCAAQSLNLVGVTESVTCYNLYKNCSIFSRQNQKNSLAKSLTKRWKIVAEHLGANRVLNSLSETRWSARANAINSLQNGDSNISEAFSSIASDINQPGYTTQEAQSLAKKVVSKYDNNARNNFDHYETAVKENNPYVD
ncbi:unnamed protein product [Pieris brassicae]|uniref:Uncharacterized protein n=1 Tax=Pieris brassicae TaxID=7116 RepID=A0A9P0TXR0_PIEBR|nr:unnamed protein product [Pieris brassicae]